MEEKLLRYRQAKEAEVKAEPKQKQNQIETQPKRQLTFDNLKKYFQKFNDLFVKPGQTAKKAVNLKRKPKMTNKEAEALNINPIEDDDDDEDKQDAGYTFNYRLKLCLKLLLWIILYGIFIKLEFGLVYFVCSLLIVICLNTRSRRRKNEISAYSVFNPNLERIDGTLTAEQLEKNLIKMF